MFPGANHRRFLAVFTRSGKSLTISSFFFFSFFLFFHPFFLFSFYFTLFRGRFSSTKKVVKLVWEKRPKSNDAGGVKPRFRHKSFLKLFFSLSSVIRICFSCFLFVSSIFDPFFLGWCCLVSSFLLGGFAVFSFSFCVVLLGFFPVWVVLLFSFSCLLLGGAAWSLPSMGGVAVFPSPVRW